MSHFAEIKTRKNTHGQTRRYLQIDLTQYENNKLLEDLLEDFFDILDVEQRKNEPTVPFEEVVRNQRIKRGLS